MANRYPLVLNGTSIEELQSVDTLVGVDVFPSGTSMLFMQTAAPTGWTKSTTHDNKALRIVSGTAGSGGSTSFSSTFTSRTPTGSVNTSGLSAGATTLSTSQMPSHVHPLCRAYDVGNWNGSYGNYNNAGTIGTGHYANIAVTYETGAYTAYMQASGSGGSHSHSMSGSATFSGSAMDFSVQYVDAIIATKN